MKKGIHPKVFKNTKITDSSSGVVFNIPSTIEEVTVEISSITHPFYTGEQKVIDSANRVKSFNERFKKQDNSSVTKKKKKKVKRAQRSKVTKVEEKKALSLSDMLKNLS